MSAHKFLIIALSLIIIMVVGCSGGKNTPMNPSSNPDDLSDIPGASIANTDGHELSGFWTLNFNPETLEVEAIPDRHPTAHMNITGMLIPSLHVNGVTDHVWDVDVTICNPYPVTGYDLRGILFTDNKGHALRNADDWTPIFDLPGGSYINPFKAFAKSEPNREFVQTCHTEKYLVYFPTDPYMVKLGISVSFPSNCVEPYSIENFTQDILFDEAGSTADVSIDVLDWQADVDGVNLYAPNITGEQVTPFTGNSGDTWTLTIENATGVVPGTYTVLTAATSGNSGNLSLYDYIDIVITAKALFVFDIVGEDTVRELNCEEYTVEALGDTGITYDWTVDPPSAGTFTDPSAMPAEFCAGEVTEDTVISIQVEVNSDSYGPIYKQKTVTIKNEDLIAHWLLDGNAEDSSGNEHHGTLTGVTFTEDRFGIPNKAAFFNGNSWISVPDHLDFSYGSNPLTLSTWIKLTSIGGYYLLGQSNGGGNNLKYMFHVGDGTIYFILHPSGGGSDWVLLGTGEFIPGQWHHVAITKSETTLTGYIDGESIGFTTGPLEMPDPVTPFLIGTVETDRPERFYRGAVDDVRIYKRALEDYEIESLYNDH